MPLLFVNFSVIPVLQGKWFIRLPRFSYTRLFFMPISQESLLLISTPNSAITVSQMHIPSKTHFQKTVGGVKKFFCGQSSRMKVTLN